MNLHGVAPAQADGRAMLALQMRKLAARAARAIRIARRRSGLANLSGPHVHGGEPRGTDSRPQARIFSASPNLQRRDRRRHRPQYARGLAGRLRAAAEARDTRSGNMR